MQPAGVDGGGDEHVLEALKFQTRLDRKRVDHGSVGVKGSRALRRGALGEGRATGVVIDGYAAAHEGA